MKWNGAKIKELLTENHIAVLSLAKSIGVTRQTVHNWLNGSLPKGQDLLKLCDYFKVGADSFFFQNEPSVKIIAHRTHRKAATTTARDEAAEMLASGFQTFFKKAKPLGIIPALSDMRNDTVYIHEIADKIRKISGIDSSKPMTYKAAFALLKELGIFTVFCDFPPNLKSYAFFSLIENHRVVFIDLKTDVLDLIFQAIHETMHCIRLEKVESYSKEEEEFCDRVACLVQFPETYVQTVVGEIRRSAPQKIIQTIKHYSQSNGHSMHGLVKAIKAYTGINLAEKANIYPTEKLLHESSSTISDILFDKGKAQIYWKRLQQFSPHFTSEIKAQLLTTSARKLAQLLSLPTSMDAQEVVDEITKASHE